MNFVRGLLIALLVAGLTLFAVANNQMLPLDFGFIQLEVWLPLLLLVAFLIGCLPVWITLAADRMALRRKVRKLEAALAESEAALSQAKVELLRPSVAESAPPTPPPADF